MKTFIFSATHEEDRKTLNVYRVKNNEPIFLGHTNFSTQHNMGDKYEAVTFLVSFNHVSKKCLDDNGYLNFDEVGKFNIFEI